MGISAVHPACHRAIDTRLERAVAIKVIAADAAGDRDRRDRFLKEARAASALNHPNIVTIHEVDLTIAWSKELGRSIDYLETRRDIDRGRIAFYGHSMGAVVGRS
jgi:hypothetical protein